MDRPVMDPTYSADHDGRPHDPLLLRICRAMAPVWRIARIALRVLVWHPLVKRRDGQFRNEDGTFWQRFTRGVCYRIAFLPVILAVVVGMFVWAGTHPQCAQAAVDPNSRGVYYEPISIPIENNPPVPAWLVPQVDAKKIIEDGENSLRKRYPAVVLIPECGKGADQVLPLIPALHDAGFVVLAMNSPRTSVIRSRGITFGLREANEVQAAVAMLRNRSSIDGKKIALVGIGTGGNAALLAAKRDATLQTLVIDHPFNGTDALRDRLGPSKAGFKWMQPLCKWGFELSYQVDADELDLANYDDLILSRKVMLLKDGATIKSLEQTQLIAKFLNSSLAR